MADASASVRVSTGWNMPVADPASSSSGAAQPALWIGARPAGGLTLPSAEPTRSQMYGPRAVWLDDERLIVADTGNHRLMIWNDPETLADHADADVVLGQPTATAEGPQAGGRGPENGVHLPTGVLVHEGRLVLADAWNHRLLIWDTVPVRSDQPPDHVIGQPDASSVEENRGADCSANSFYWPFGLCMVDGHLWVSDTGNRRVVVFDGVPEPEQDPAFILGQASPTERDENRGALGPASFRWPHDVASDGNGGVFVADAGNHRLLGWSATPHRDEPADRLLGQPDFETAIEIPYAPQSASTLRFPYAVDIDEDVMVVADTANNRVLIWDNVPQASHAAATRVLGQRDFGSIGENRWESVAPDTFCWPYGLSLHNGRLAVADSGNNRVVVWTLG